MNQPGERFRYALDFRVTGDIRFISHNDMLRMFARACARARLPVVFTQGFNPRARLWLPFPRPVGQSSEGERFEIDLHAPLESAELMRSLQAQLPVGLTVMRAVRLAAGRPGQPAWVRYRISIAPADWSALRRQAETLLGSETVPVTRVRHKDQHVRVVDIRPWIDGILVAEDAVYVNMHLSGSGAATPGDVCTALGLKADAINHLIHRMEIRWQSRPTTQSTPP